MSSLEKNIIPDTTLCILAEYYPDNTVPRCSAQHNGHRGSWPVGAPVHERAALAQHKRFDDAARWPEVTKAQTAAEAAEAGELQTAVQLVLAGLHTCLEGLH